MSDADRHNDARVDEPGRHECVPLGDRGCRLCVFSPEHPTHQGAEVIDLLAARRARHAETAATPEVAPRRT